jgi:hypothetical protein
MSSELVTIACHMPQGLRIEVGIERIPGVWGSVSKGPNYATATLNGWNSTNPSDIQPIATLTPQPGLTQIPKDLWDVWCERMGKFHPARLNKLITVVPNASDKAGMKSAVRDVAAKRTGFEPLDPNKLPEGVEEAPVLGRRPLGSRPVRQA